MNIKPCPFRQCDSLITALREISERNHNADIYSPRPLIKEIGKLITTPPYLIFPLECTNGSLTYCGNADICEPQERN